LRPTFFLKKSGKRLAAKVKAVALSQRLAF